MILAWLSSSRERELKAVSRGPRTIIIERQQRRRNQKSRRRENRERGWSNDRHVKERLVCLSVHWALDPGFCPAELPAVLGCPGSVYCYPLSKVLCSISVFVGRKFSPFPRKMMAATDDKVRQESLVLRRNKNWCLSDLLCAKRREIPGGSIQLLPLPINRSGRAALSYNWGKLTWGTQEVTFAQGTQRQHRKGRDGENLQYSLNIKTDSYVWCKLLRYFCLLYKVKRQSLL